MNDPVSQVIEDFNKIMEGIDTTANSLSQQERGYIALTLLAFARHKHDATAPVTNNS